MAYRYYDLWAAESKKRMEEVRRSKASVESLLQKGGTDRPEMASKLEEVSRILSDAEGFHGRYRFPEALRKSAEAMKVLKELQYLALATKE